VRLFRVLRHRHVVHMGAHVQAGVRLFIKAACDQKRRWRKSASRLLDSVRQLLLLTGNRLSMRKGRLPSSQKVKFCDNWESSQFLYEANSILAQRLAAHRATVLANVGPNSNTRMKRAICIAMTNGRSTWEEAAMIATESAPPGLVAR